MSLPDLESELSPAVVSHTRGQIDSAQVCEAPFSMADLKSMVLHLVMRSSAELLGTDTHLLLQGCQDAHC